MRVGRALLFAVLHRGALVTLAEPFASLIDIVDRLAVSVQWLVRAFRKAPAAVIGVFAETGHFLQVHDHLIYGQKLPGVGDAVTRAWFAFDRARATLELDRRLY